MGKCENCGKRRVVRDVRLVSLGGGRYRAPLCRRCESWGLLQFKGGLLSVLGRGE